MQKLILAIIAISTLFAAIVALSEIASKWPSLEPSQQASILANGIGAMGTLLLAIATVLTVVQNTWQMEQQKYEKEKPLAKNEAIHLIKPAINALRSNIEHLEEDYEIDWLQYNPSLPSSFGRVGVMAGVPTPIVPSKDPHALVRLEKDRPDLYQEIQEHDEMIHHLANRADQIGEQIDKPLNQYNENNLESRLDDSNVQNIKSAIIRESDQFAENHELHDIWDKHREAFLDILYSNAEREIEDLRALEDTYHEHCDNLLLNLEDRSEHLKGKYKFTTKDIGENSDTEVPISGKVR